MTSDFLKKFLTIDQIETALEEVVRLAKQQNVDVALAGGVAMQLYGSDRLTKDVDFLASENMAGLKKPKPLSFGGYKGYLKGIPVDMIVRDDDAKDLYDVALETSKYSKDLGCRVVQPEYLAALKLQAGRMKDHEDLASLVRTKSINLPTTRKIIRATLGAFAVKEFDSHVYEVQWRQSMEKSRS